MSKKISEFETKTSPTTNAYLPLIDKSQNTFENYKLKIVDYFYNKSEINDKIAEINNKLIAFEATIAALGGNITDGNTSLSNYIDEQLNILENRLNLEINKKQNKNVGTANKVIVSNSSGNITTSVISTIELGCLSDVKDNIQTQINDINLVGEIIWYSGNKKPDGNYLICNGAAVSRTKYKNLFETIGTIYGEGDKTTTFNIPNLINKVAWGAATGGGYISAGLPNIQGSFGAQEPQSRTPVSGAFVHSDTASGVREYDGGTAGGYEISFNAALSSSIYGSSSTVQPPAVKLMPLIRY